MGQCHSIYEMAEIGQLLRAQAIHPARPETDTQAAAETALGATLPQISSERERSRVCEL